MTHEPGGGEFEDVEEDGMERFGLRDERVCGGGEGGIRPAAYHKGPLDKLEVTSIPHSGVLAGVVRVILDRKDERDRRVVDPQRCRTSRTQGSGGVPLQEGLYWETALLVQSFVRVKRPQLVRLLRDGSGRQCVRVEMLHCPLQSSETARGMINRVCSP
jgi:hypothetical protein